MSNNKQIMKLYTEEQMRKALRTYFDLSKFLTESDVIKEFTPIELPSDEEIEEIAFRSVNGLTDYLTPKELNCLREGYMNGMKLLINVIQGGNK